MVEIEPLRPEFLESNRVRAKHAHAADADQDRRDRDNSWAESFRSGAEAFGIASFQEPLNGMSQLANQLIGKELIGRDILPTLDVIPEPSKTTLGERKWFFEAVGAGIGSMVPFLAIEKSTGLLGNTQPFRQIRATADNIPLAKSLMGLEHSNFDAMHLSKMTMDGGIYGAFLVPAPDEDRFWQERAYNSVGVAVTFGTQFGVSHGILNKLEKTGVGHMHFQPGSELNAKTISTRLISNLVGGSAAGFVGLETMSGLYGYGPASGKQIADTVAGFAVTGAAIDSFHIGQEVWHHQVEKRERLKEEALTPTPEATAPSPDATAPSPDAAAQTGETTAPVLEPTPRSEATIPVPAPETPILMETSPKTDATTPNSVKKDFPTASL